VCESRPIIVHMSVQRVRMTCVCVCVVCVRACARTHAHECVLSVNVKITFIITYKEIM